MKNWILKTVSFLVFFSIVVTLVFELSFRFISYDFFIHIMNDLGFKASFDSLVLFLIVISFFVSLFIYSVCIFIITIAKRGV